MNKIVRISKSRVERTPLSLRQIDTALRSRAESVVDEFNLSLSSQDLATLVGRSWLNDEACYVSVLYVFGISNDSRSSIFMAS